LGFQEVEGSEFLDNRHMKVVRLSARLYPQEDNLLYTCNLATPAGMSHLKIKFYLYKQIYHTLLQLQFYNNFNIINVFRYQVL
jgi:hypothetical protein